MIPALLLLLQSSSADVVPPVPQKFSVLVDAAPPCERAPGSRTDQGDIVVCAPVDQAERLPLRDERGPPDGPAPSNPYRTGEAALDNSRPCSASHDCIVGFGPPIVPMIKGAADLAKKAFGKKPDKTGRVPIDLGDPTPKDTASRVLP